WSTIYRPKPPKLLTTGSYVAIPSHAGIPGSGNFSLNHGSAIPGIRDKLIAPAHIHRRRQHPALAVSVDIPSDDGGSCIRVCRGRYVGQDRDGWMRPKRRIRWQRLDVEHIQHRVTYITAVERCEQSRCVDDGATGEIDELRPFW